MARLRIVSGPLGGQTVEVEGELVIGREDGDLEIGDLEMSRRHAVVRRVANRLQVEDLGSSNGTFVDGARIEEPTLCGGGAEIRMGTTVIVVEGVLPVSSPNDRGQVADPKATRISEVPAEMAAATTVASEPPVAPAPAATPTAPTAVPLGEFRPPERRRTRGLASRSWIPVALSFGTVFLTALGLVLYFALR
jgi:pSer/pThr/pTyr-binding forkhead associated (FHA) protein